MLGYFLRCGTLYFVLAKYNYGKRIIRYSYKIFNMNFFFSFTIIPDLEERDSRKRFPSKVFFFLTLIKHWMREKKEWYMKDFQVTINRSWIECMVLFEKRFFSFVATHFKSKLGTPKIRVRCMFPGESLWCWSKETVWCCSWWTNQKKHFSFVKMVFFFTIAIWVQFL